MTAKIRVDMRALSFEEIAEIEEVTGKPMTEVMNTARGMAGVVWVSRRRHDPAFTYQDALKLSPLDLEVVNVDADPEALAASNGGTPQPSPASGS